MSKHLPVPAAIAASVLLSSVTLVQGSVLVTTAELLGSSEASPNSSPGSGTATVTYDDTTHLLTVEVSFSGLEGNVTAAHIHAATAVPNAGTAGVATPVPTFPGFPGGVTSGTYSESFDLTQASSWNPAFVTAAGSVANAEAALAAALMNETAYLNIHSTSYSTGEIRGFLVPVPEPGAAAFLGGLGLIGFGISRRVWGRRG